MRFEFKVKRSIFEKKLLNAIFEKKGYIRLEKLFMTSRSMKAINIWIKSFFKNGNR